ncbi:MAG: SAM-dependent methyltransferase [Lachnospiraceae bacterium]|nr:SAM-dependent methyltransferase [Lachnospiraceae bacterium]
MIKLSKRLKAIADMVPLCDTFTDIGTDHGYLPVYLLLNNICNKAYASDIKKGPLMRAKENAERYGIGSDRIRFVLSDGLDRIDCPLNGRNVLSMTGMGGKTIADILIRGREKALKYNELILSPHTKQAELRRYLSENGYRIIEEKHLVDEAKLYVIIKAVFSGFSESEEYSDIYYSFGDYIDEALTDEEVREEYIRQYLEIRELLSNNNSLPQKRLQELSDKEKQYKEVLGFET